jgi:hypothetical protein
VTRRDTGPETSAGAPRSITTGLPFGQRRVLARTENAIRASDPQLACMLELFGWLGRTEEMPLTERIAARTPPRRRWARRRRVSAGCEERQSFNAS